MAFRPHATRKTNHRVQLYEKPICWHKRRFKDKRDAIASLRHIQHKNRERGSMRDSTPMRVYECDLCKGGWHLTSSARGGMEDDGRVMEEGG